MPFERQYNGNKVRECIQKYEHFKSLEKWRKSPELENRR
jgi:hypothetical protein